MKLKLYTYFLQLSNQKESIYLDQIEAEKIILSLIRAPKPQFIKLEDGLINTSYIISILKDYENYNKEGNEERELDEEEEKIHNLFLKIGNKKELLTLSN